MAPSTAVELVKVGDRATQATLAEAAVNGLSRDAVSAEVKRQKNGQAKAERTPRPLKRVTIQVGDGLSVTVTGEALTREVVAAALDQAREEVRRGAVARIGA